MLMYGLYTALFRRISPCLTVARYIFQQPVRPVYLVLLIGFCGVANAALDPTQPAPSAATAATAGTVEAALVLQSIVRGGRQSQVVINGKTLRLGDELGGAKLLAIYPNSVVLERQGQQQVLRLAEPILKPSR